MASQKKEYEGIDLLSIYGDEDDDYREGESDNDENRIQIDAVVVPENELGGYGISRGEGEDSGKSPTPSPLVQQQQQVGMDKLTPTTTSPLEKFLPPPPKTRCSDELQQKINRFLDLKKTTGRSFNAEVRNRKEYRNPDFLRHAVQYQGIDEIGSCFSKDVFDPHGYDKCDFYDEIEADVRREMERKEQERKNSQKVDFISGGTQPGAVIMTTKPNLPIPGSGLNTALTSVDAIPQDSRHNKKSKWDKVDVDRRDVISAVGAHATLLSAAFAQQKRKETEEKRSVEKKLDPRS